MNMLPGVDYNPRSVYQVQRDKIKHWPWFAPNVRAFSSFEVRKIVVSQTAITGAGPWDLEDQLMKEFGD